MKKFFAVMALAATFTAWLGIESVDEKRYLEQDLANWQVLLAIIALVAILVFIGFTLFGRVQKRHKVR